METIHLVQTSPLNAPCFDSSSADLQQKRKVNPASWAVCERRVCSPYSVLLTENILSGFSRLRKKLLAASGTTSVVGEEKRELL